MALVKLFFSEMCLIRLILLWIFDWMSFHLFFMSLVFCITDVSVHFFYSIRSKGPLNFYFATQTHKTTSGHGFPG